MLVGCGRISSVDKALALLRVLKTAEQALLSARVEWSVFGGLRL